MSLSQFENPLSPIIAISDMSDYLHELMKPIRVDWLHGEVDHMKEKLIKGIEKFENRALTDSMDAYQMLNSISHCKDD